MYCPWERARWGVEAEEWIEIPFKITSILRGSFSGCLDSLDSERRSTRFTLFWSLIALFSGHFRCSCLFMFSLRLPYPRRKKNAISGPISGPISQLLAITN